MSDARETLRRVGSGSQKGARPTTRRARAGVLRVVYAALLWCAVLTATPTPHATGSTSGLTRPSTHQPVKVKVKVRRWRPHAAIVSPACHLNYLCRPLLRRLARPRMAKHMEQEGIRATPTAAAAGCAVCTAHGRRETLPERRERDGQSEGCRMARDVGCGRAASVSARKAT